MKFKTLLNTLLKTTNTPNFIFFLQKQNDIHSFKLIEYIRINIAKNVKDESAKKLTTPKLITYTDKMPTKNMMKSKSPEFPILPDLQRWHPNHRLNLRLTEADISIWIKQRRTRRRTTQCRTHTTKSQKTQKKTLNIYGNHLFRLKEKKKRMHRGDSRSKKDLKPALLDEWKRKKT